MAFSFPVALGAAHRTGKAATMGGACKTPFRVDRP
jgi:hypothetical protein